MTTPYISEQRAKGATRAENQNIDWRNADRYPVLFEQKIQGVTVDVRAPGIRIDPTTRAVVPILPHFEASRVQDSRIYRWDRHTGVKTFVGILPAREGSTPNTYPALQAAA